MYANLFKKWKTPIGFAVATILTVIVLFSGEDSLIGRLRNSFGEHPEVSADQSVAVETTHPAEIPVIMNEPQASEEDPGFVDDEELVDDGSGDDPTPPEENIDGNDDTSADDGGSAEQVIIVNPGAPQPG